jgi:hypoxanthine phosphoribosyltransferase
MYYQKKDKTKSIKGGLKKDDFVLTLEKNKLLKSILVIDDIIDKGDTLNFFLEHMVDNGNVDNQTNITFCGIYCNDRIENKLTLEKIREIMKKPSH